MAAVHTPTPGGDISLPAHIAIIMDGNGRWAEQRGIARKLGHKQGAETLRRLLEYCRDLKHVNYLTVYAFSSENWNRPEEEVSDLMGLLNHYLSKESSALHAHGIRIRFIGDRSRLSPSLQRSLANAESLTAENTVFTLVIALSYGGRQELLRAVQRLYASHKVAESITEASIVEALDTAGIPDPDLLIRTGGEQRLSNFLLWQSAYTELYFTEALWPDFTPDHLRQAIECFSQRERRFGTRLRHG